jgi:O-antigen ligase
MKLKFTNYIVFVAIIISPILYLPIVPDPAQSIVFWVLSLGMFLHTIFNQQSKPSIRMNLIDWILIFLMVFGGFSIFLIANNSESWMEYFRFLFFVASFYFWRFHRHLESNALHVFIVLGAVYMISGFWDYMQFKNEKDLFLGLYDIRARIGHKNLLAVYLNLSLCFTYIVWVKTHSKVIRHFLIGYIGFAVLLVLLVQSRVGLLGLLIISLMIVLANSRALKTTRFKITMFVLIGIFLFIIGISQKKQIVAFGERIFAVTEITNLRTHNNQSVQERIDLWSASIRMIKDKHWMGCGLGQWKFFIAQYDIQNTRYKFGHIFFQQPHNDILWVFCEYGVIGGLGFLAIWFLSFYKVGQNIKQDPSQHIWLVFLTTFFVSSCFDFLKERPIFLFLLAFSLSIIFSKNSINNVIKKPKLMILILIVMVLFFAKRIVLESYLAIITVKRTNQEWCDVNRLSKQALRLGLDFDHTATPMPFYIGESHFNEKKLDSAIPFMIQSLQMNPTHLYSWSILGKIYAIQGRDIDAVIAWHKALDLANNFVEARLNLAQYYLQKNEIERSLYYFKMEIEEEDVLKYETQIISIFKGIVLALPQDFQKKNKSELHHILNTNKRLIWIFKKYGIEQETFADQISKDIDFNCHNKRYKTSVFD